MIATFSYLGRSGLVESGSGAALNLAPNLAREPVSFDAALRKPLRFREAVSALHDIVISDLRHKKRDHSAHDAWKEEQRLAEERLRGERMKTAKAEIERRAAVPLPPGFEREFERHRSLYWKARRQYSNHLLAHDRELWRHLMPCDPVITVAPDALLFECFSADESSYGCLSVNRDDGFGASDSTALGTTNVDYSWDLYGHFQTLRTYRETRLRLDPAGFSAATAGAPGHREEKIDLPSSWLRGFTQLQTAMSLPSRVVTLGRDAVYALLAHLRRHKAARSPRALRFELPVDAPPTLVLEPWELRIPVRGVPACGGDGQPIRIWGRQRLLALARVLPLAEKVEVRLLGTGLPSLWTVHLGEMRLTLGLSGWTTNDWTRTAALDQILPPEAPGPGSLAKAEEFLRRQRTATLAEVAAACGDSPAGASAALRRLAGAGQVLADPVLNAYRWRQIMPRALGEAELGPPHPEQAGCADILAGKRAVVELVQPSPDGRQLVAGRADREPVELALDADGAIRRAKCGCAHFRKFGLRAGPCRHLQAVRLLAWRDARAAGVKS